MRSPILNQCAGRGYNSPVQQVNMHTKIKDVPGELINSGKKVINNVSNAFTNFKNSAVNTAEEVSNKISNSTVGDAVDFLVGPGANTVLGKVKQAGSAISHANEAGQKAYKNSRKSTSYWGDFGGGSSRRDDYTQDPIEYVRGFVNDIVSDNNDKPKPKKLMKKLKHLPKKK
jgi:hypothetical protein